MTLVKQEDTAYIKQFATILWTQIHIGPILLYHPYWCISHFLLKTCNKKIKLAVKVTDS